MNRYDTTWTATDELWLTTLWTHGESLTAIGKTMGRSRNAVAGKARRLGVCGRGSPLKPRMLPSRRSCAVCGVPFVAVPSVIKTCGKSECMAALRHKPPRQFDHEKMCRLRQEGVGPTAIARIMGCSLATAWKVTRDARQPKVVLDVDRMQAMRGRGLSLHNIARRLRCSKVTVWRHTRGVEVRA